MELITDQNYNEKVMKSEKPFLLYFKSNNCSHCVVVEAYLSRINKDKEKPCDFNIFIIQSEKSPKLLELYKVKAFPTTLFFKKDKKLNYLLIGAETLGKFVEEIKNICNSKSKKFLGIF